MGPHGTPDRDTREPASSSAVTPTLLDDEVQAPTREDSDAARGGSIGRYVILERIGAGGMGVVYTAWDPELSRRVAVKLLHASDRLEARGTKGHARLLREAQALARLGHPNVVTVHDAGTFEGRVFLAMEYIEGRTFGAWLRAKPRSWSEIVAVAIEMGRGLAAAHAQGLVHRDFKPDNVLVGDDGRPRVLDFGLARSFGEKDPVEVSDLQVPRLERRNTGVHAIGSDALSVSLTETGAMAGTPAYMAPEQHQRMGVDARSDQFAFCVSLWEALYGERPFAGETRMELILQVCSGTLREPPTSARVPAFLRAALQRGLSVKPEDRFASMDELLAVLARPPKRRGVQVLAAIAVVGAIAGIAFDLRSERAEDPCRAGQDEAAAMWGEDARTRLGEAINGVRASYASDAWTAVDTGLRTYVDAWASGYRDACEAFHVRHELSDDLFDRRMACLRERSHAVVATVRALESPDTDVVANAAKAVAELPRIEPCSDTAALLAGVPPPEDPDTRARVEALELRLVQAAALERAGRHREGHEALAEIRSEADAIDYEPLLAEVKFRQGANAQASHGANEAEALLEEAVLHAIAIGHDEMLARAMTRLALVVGVGRSHYDAGELWGRQAEAAVRRYGERTDVGVEHAGAMCMLLADRSAPARAMPYCEKSVALATELYGPDHLLTSQALRAQGNALYIAGESARAAESFGRAHTLAVAVLGEDHPDVAVLLNSLAACCHAREPPGSCVDEFEETLAAAERAFGPEHPVVADFSNNYAVVLHAAKRDDEAQRYAERSLAIRTRAGVDHPGMFAAHQTLGMVAQARGDLETALDHFDRAVEGYARTRGESHVDVVTALQARATARIAAQHVEAGLADYTRALRLARQLDRPAREITGLRRAIAKALVERAP